MSLPVGTIITFGQLPKKYTVSRVIELPHPLEKYVPNLGKTGQVVLYIAKPKFGRNLHFGNLTEIEAAMFFDAAKVRVNLDRYHHIDAINVIWRPE